jgi:hypothetical protein
MQRQSAMCLPGPRVRFPAAFRYVFLIRRFSVQRGPAMCVFGSHAIHQRNSGTGFFTSQVLDAAAFRYVFVRLACYSLVEFRYGFLHFTGS